MLRSGQGDRRRSRFTSLYVALVPTWGDKLTAPWGAGPRLFRSDNLGECPRVRALPGAKTAKLHQRDMDPWWRPPSASFRASQRVAAQTGHRWGLSSRPGLDAHLAGTRSRFVGTSCLPCCTEFKQLFDRPDRVRIAGQPGLAFSG